VAPSLEKIAKDYDGKVIVAKVNTDENPEWMQQYEISGIPTMLFVANGKIVYRQVGAVPFGFLKNIVDKFLEVVAVPAEPAVPAAEPAKDDKQAVRELKDIRATTTAKDVNKPTEIKTAEEAAKVFDKDALEKVKKDVDFNKEKLVCFDWEGSGQDMLAFKLDKDKDAPVVVFTYTRGATKDLRMHARVFVMPRDMKWRVGDKKE